MPLSYEIEPGDITRTLADVEPWKAAGPDGFPVGFLWTCGWSAASCLSDLFNACLRLGHWPGAFRQATVAVLPRPGKTATKKRVARRVQAYGAAQPHKKGA